VTLGALHVVGALPALWLAPLLGQFWLLRRVTRRLESDLAGVTGGTPALRSLGPKLRLVERTDWEAEFLRDAARRLDVSDEPAHRRLERLGRLVDIVESRRNLFYQAANPLFLLDAHLGVALDRWRATSGGHVVAWSAALGEVDAVSALACLAHDHPDWTFPENVEASEPTGPVLRARGLGHPLLDPRECVRNDVEVGPPGTFLLVTGSNMSGKSTLLRAIGANVVLASAGGPVCAESLELPPIRLHTSMTVNDSLEDGVSRFMAELLRVRSIVGAAREPSEAPVLYLLDELLQGTNTAERRVAAQAILRHLLDAGAVGALTTHDLTLHEAPDLAPRARAWHFRESVEEGGGETRLDFDYRLRSGLATTRNALKLLEAVGLGRERSADRDVE
jgi:DNA mismatch repair ATPase MutS